MPAVTVMALLVPVMVLDSGIGGSQGLNAHCLERHAEIAHAVDQRGVGRQRGLGVRAGEVHRAGVPGDRVVADIQGRDREDHCIARRDRGRAAGDAEVRRHRRAHGDVRRGRNRASTVSVAVKVCTPAVFSVALKVPVPLVKVLLAGRTAWASLLVKCTVPV